MRLLYLKPQIHKFDSFKSFAEEFALGEKDLILTRESIYQPYIRELHLKCTFVLQNRYGSGEPSDEMIDRIIRDCRLEDFDRIIAIGGGTVIDIAKILTLDGVVHSRDVYERKVPLTKKRELVVIPTTCGTGSEVTNISIAEISDLQTKLGLGTDEISPDHAVLIPTLLDNLPFNFFVYSSMDALVHAMESYVSPKSNAYTELFSTAAIRMILDGYREILEKGEEYRKEIMEEFLIASNYAGIAFGNTGVGAVHALSYPLGGKYHVPHGECNYQFLIEVFNTYIQIEPQGKISGLAGIISGIIGGTTGSGVFDRLGSFLNGIIRLKRLGEYGMRADETEIFAENVFAKQQRLLINSYVPMSRETIASIYRKLY